MTRGFSFSFFLSFWCSHLYSTEESLCCLYITQISPFCCYGMRYPYGTVSQSRDGENSFRSSLAWRKENIPFADCGGGCHFSIFLWRKWIFHSIIIIIFTIPVICNGNPSNCITRLFESLDLELFLFPVGLLMYISNLSWHVFAVTEQGYKYIWMTSGCNCQYPFYLYSLANGTFYGWVIASVHTRRLCLLRSISPSANEWWGETISCPNEIRSMCSFLVLKCLVSSCGPWGDERGKIVASHRLGMKEHFQ